MKERPILFSSEMVRAILDGRKTMTRRVIKPQPEYQNYMNKPNLHWSECGGRSQEEIAQYCPYGAPGDRLWVRETCKIFSLSGIEPYTKEVVTISYRAGGAKEIEKECMSEKIIKGGLNLWTPSIFMPRWASRITLEITNVRVERVQDITQADAKAEGAEPWFLGSDGRKELKPGCTEFSIEYCPEEKRNYRKGFEILWNSVTHSIALETTLKDDHEENITTTNAKRGCGWDMNPWVWVIEFKQLKGGEG